MGETVDYVFLHGGVQGGWVWDETLAALVRQGGGAARTLALDVPGCGKKRGRATEGLGPDEVAAELVADIEAAGLGEVVLVGHSQAGTVSPRMVEQRPGLFRRLVHVSCIAPLAGQTVMNFRQSGLPPAPEASAAADWSQAGDLRALYRAIFCNDMDEEEAQAFLAKLGADAWPQRMYEAADWRYARPGAAPASYVVCLRDGVLPVAWQEVFAERLGAARLVRIDAGHQVMNTRPQALAEVLRAEARA